MKRVIQKSEQILDSLRGKRVLVVGDLMIDEYIWGEVSRISPEAPVPVVGVDKETLRLGGAANVAHNVISLNGLVEICGVAGDDQMGRWMLRDLKAKGIGTRGVVTSLQRPTTVKTRIMAHSQQVVRVDREVTTPLSREDEEAITASVRSLVGECGCLVISDYAKGVVTPTLIKEIVALGREAGVPVAVDPKINHFNTYQGVTVLTPNLLEASAGAGIIVDSMEALAKAGAMIIEKLNCDNLIITRGDQGMSLFSRDGEIRHIPSVSRHVYDVTGAGDTVVATLALALAGGRTMEEGAYLANVAAGIVVGEVGTAVVTEEQMRQRFRELASWKQ